MTVLTSTFQPLKGTGNPDGCWEVFNTLVEGQVHIDPIQLLRSFLESQDQRSEAKPKQAREKGPGDSAQSGEGCRRKDRNWSGGGRRAASMVGLQGGRGRQPGGVPVTERDSGDRKGGPHYQVREPSVGRHLNEVASGASYTAKARRNPIRSGDPASLRLALHILPGSHSLTPHIPEHLPLSNSPETTCLSG